MSAPRSQRFHSSFARPNSHRFLHLDHKNLPVADLPCFRCLQNRIDRALDAVIGDHDLEFHLGQKIDRVFAAAINFAVPFLSPESFHFAHGHPFHADFRQGFAHRLALKRLDHRLNFFHRAQTRGREQKRKPTPALLVLSTICYRCHMRIQDAQAIFRALNEANVRYLVVGGIAVIAHGYVRLTVDLDIVLHLEPENVMRAMQALEAIGYHPLVPVQATEFADAEKRRHWIEEKNMIVFQMRHSDPESTRLDIFVKEPFPFNHEYERAYWDEVEGVRIPIVCYDELLNLKRRSGRAQDLLDIEHLLAMEDKKENEQSAG